MGDKILQFLKKHTTIQTKAILLIYVIVIVYKASFVTFQFSIVRFLKAGLGEAFLIIGAFMAISNFIAIFVDIPLGVLQKYIKPRIFLLIAVGMLLISDLIFLVSTLNLWIAFLAMFLYQMSIEIYAITIITYILRLSTSADSSQNIAQEDIADNVGDLIGLAMGGGLFVVDRFLGAHNMFVMAFLAIILFSLFFFIFEFLDRKHHSSLEEYIFNLRFPKKILETTTAIEEKIVQDPDAVVVVQEEETERKVSFREIRDKFVSTFENMYAIFTNKLHAPILLWAMFVLAITYFWYETINYFEPVYMKEIFKEGVGWVVENVPRYIFESIMLITGILVPTFFLELRFGKLADIWGKEKMVILGTLFSGAALFIMGFLKTPLFIYFIYMAVGCGFVIIYPPLTGLFNERYKDAVAQKKEQDSAQLNLLSPTEESKDEMVEGDSAAMISIVMNIGQILAGLVGGFLFQLFEGEGNYGFIFTIYGALLVVTGVLSIFFVKKFSSDTSKAEG